MKIWLSRQRNVIGKQGQVARRAKALLA